MTRTTGLSILLTLALASCTGTLYDGVPPDDDPGGDLGSAESALTVEVSDVIQIAGILGYELSGLLGEDTPEGIPGLTEDGAPSGGEAMPGPSGATPVGTDDCTDVDWEPTNLAGVVVTFDNCVLDDGDILHGSVAVRLGGALAGTIEADLDDLAIGDEFITGPITLTLSGSSIRVDADLQYLDPETNLGVELDGVELSVSGSGVHLNGEATIVENGERMQATLNEVTWSVASLCHPSSGSVDLDRPGQPPMSILFSADRVTVQVAMEEPVVVPMGC